MVLMAVLLLLAAQHELEEKSERIQTLLHAGKFDEAEPLVRECLKQAPEEIYFLGQLDMVLNGQGKFGDADALRDRIRKLWEQKYKEKWIAKGAPVSESSWARMITTSKEYYVIGTEYFIPRLLEGANHDDPLALFAFSKVIALPKQGSGPARILQLNKTRNENNYFLEEYSESAIIMAAKYGRNEPDIRAVVTDAVRYLDRKSK
jgi:hypothetical protein